MPINGPQTSRALCRDLWLLVGSIFTARALVLTPPLSEGHPSGLVGFPTGWGAGLARTLIIYACRCYARAAKACASAPHLSYDFLRTLL